MSKFQEYLEMAPSPKQTAHIKKGEFVITDNGKEIVLHSTEHDKDITLPRYGVWSTATGKMEIVEVSNNLKKLQKKYNVKEVIKV